MAISLRRKHRILLGLCTAGSLMVGAWTRPSTAQELTGVELGVRTGYSLPFGKGGADATRDLKEGIAGAIPLWLDLGYRINPQFMVGGYFLYGFGFLGDYIDQLCSNADCSTHDIRAGAQLQFHAMPRGPSDPWVGVGVGYEWLTWSIASGGLEGSITGSGFQFVNFQAGLDLLLGDSPAAAIGPFLDFSIGEFSDVSCSGPVLCPTNVDTTNHEWLTLGVRGRFVP
jgi:hypothetical protein